MRNNNYKHWQYKDDPHFAEFLQVNRRGGRKVLWSNDVNEGQEEDINSTNAQNNKPSDLEVSESSN